MTKQDRLERLAAQILSGMMANQELINIVTSRDNNLSDSENMCRTAVTYAERLISEIEKHKKAAL